MKLTTLFLLIGLMQVSASVYSQSTKLTLEMRNKKVVEVLEEIEKQSEFRFAYSSELIDLERRVSVDLRKRNIEETLNIIFDGTGVKYAVHDRHIMLYPKEMDSSEFISSQQNAITGKVTDDSGQPLPGVTVLIKGTTQGTVTNANGDYSLTDIPENSTLAFSFVGMVTQEITVSNQTEIDVTMEIDAIGIEEVVAIGYGTMKRSDLTGSVIRADIEAFNEAPNVNLLQSMQGSTPGLNIGMVTSAGQTPSVSIRGTTTLSGNKSVLIVVDGIIYHGSMSDFNSNDIESVDVLKDASSSAIYGAQAANGVILITTKKGKKVGKPMITYSTSYSSVEPAHKLLLMRREELLKHVRNVYWQDGYTESSGYIEDNPDFSIETALQSPENVLGYNNGYDIDWYADATNKGNIQKHNLNIRGVSNNVSYFISAGYDKQKNWIINDHFNRKTVRINLETDITDWLKVGAQTFGAFSDYSGGSPNLRNLVLAGSLRNPYTEEGDLVYRFESIENPLVPTARNDYDKRNSLFGNFFGKISVPFIPGLNYTINYGNNLRWSNQYYSDDYARSESGEARKTIGNAYDYTLDNIINYKKVVNDIHNFNVTLVAGISERVYENTNALAFNFSNLILGYNSLEQGVEQYTYSDSWEEASSYQMARLNYTLDNKYLLTATIRRDGFSGFAKNEKTAIFPSVALAWVASKEKFLSDIDWLSNLKLRASWGVNGNLVGRYSSLARVSSSAAYVFGDGGSTQYGHVPTTLASPNLRWEKTEGLNLGLDYAILGGIVNGSVEYYSTTTNDLLWSQALPSITGFSSIIGNIGEIKNNGFEMTVNANPVRTNNFRWDLNLNFSTNKNKVVHLLGDRDGDGIEDDLISSGLFIDKSLGTIYTYDIAGIYQIGDEVPAGYRVGGYEVVDQPTEEDGIPDGVINSDDRVFMGKSSPAYRFSIQNELKYKDFTLRVFLNSIQGGKNSYLMANEPFNAGWWQSSNNAAKNGMFSGIDYWTPSNPDAEYKLPGATGAINPSQYKSRSFVRLQDVSLAYNFNNKLTTRWGIGGLKLYVSGKNLYTWTKWKGWDPETGGGIVAGSYPVMRNYSLGLEVTF